MPWLLGATSALRGLGGRLAASRVGSLVGRFGLPIGLGVGGSALGDAVFGGPEGGRRRRRRRRALTASDKADIAFISGTLGKTAGKDFAMIVASKI